MAPESQTESEGQFSPSLSLPSFFVVPRFFYRVGVRIVAIVGLDLFLVFFMASLLVLTLWNNGASIRLGQESVLYPIGIMSFLLLTRFLLWCWRHTRGKNGQLALKNVFLQTLRDWIPFIIIDFIYENLHDLSRLFHTHDVAGTLMQWDIKIFGVEPTLWCQKFFHPLLTDYMAFAYALYFIFPLVIMYLLSYRNKRGELREVILALALTFLCGFVGYVIFPCSPPRYFLEHEFTNPPHLYGLFLFNQLQGKWDSLSAIPGGAFPSLHVGISSIALIYAFRFRTISRFDRGLYWIYLPLVVSLWISTVYLRHHWIIDIVAGWGIALASAALAPLITNAWENMRERLGIPSGLRALTPLRREAPKHVRSSS